MFKSLRVPEALFRLLMWIVSFVFAGFLIGLGGKIIRPPAARKSSLRSKNSPIGRARRGACRDTSRCRRASAISKISANTRASRSRPSATPINRRARRYTNWIQTRNATSDPRQDPEVLTRTRELDVLKTERAQAQTTVEGLDKELLDVRQARERSEVDGCGSYSTRPETPIAAPLSARSCACSAPACPDAAAARPGGLDGREEAQERLLAADARLRAVRGVHLFRRARAVPARATAATCDMPSASC